MSKEPLPTIESLSGEIAQLRVQIQYQERRNSDLQARNQKLEKRSQEFMALKAACTQHRLLLVFSNRVTLRYISHFFQIIPQVFLNFNKL